MKRRFIASTLLGSLLLSGWARAGETPLYQPAPDWVIPAQLPDPATLASGGPAALIIDRQQLISGGNLWSYSDIAQRISTAEQLNQLSNLNLPWLPDKGDLIVHELAIVRGGESIDLLAAGQSFTVIRREQALERRELTGILTATTAVEGLRVGDILRVRASTTSKDNALGGHVQGMAPLIAAPVNIGEGRLRTLWDNASDVKWKVGLSGITATPVRGEKYTELNIPLPAPRQLEVPADAPGRFKPLPILEVTTFADWADVSRTMHPLFATDGLLKAGSPILAEIEAIKRSERTALGRTQKALRLVQDQIRYLAVSMDGGNYVPQTPEQTWALRYGDCKAKTLLLLAMLREMGIEAEAVLAHTEAGSAVANRLPSAAAFNHIIVRAVINGESLWLDGTGMGSRIEDIRDTPNFGHVLPLRADGADITPIEPRTSGRPSFDLTMRMDESSSLDLPSVFDLSLVLRGATGAQINLVRTQLDSQKQHEVMGQFLSRIVGDSLFGDITLTPDDQAGIVTINARGVTASAWRWDDKTLQRGVNRGLSTINFQPDRARAAWSSIPVATPPPDGRRFVTEIRLPQGGEGFRLEGATALTDKVAGLQISHKTSIAKGVLTMEERIDSTGAEIAANMVGAERDRLATAKAQAPKLVAPANILRSWDLTQKDPAGGTQIAAAEAVFASAITHDPSNAAAYRGRAALRHATNNTKAAIIDITSAIELEPDVSMYLMRAQLHEALGDLQSALADADAARNLDPSSVPATFKVATLLAENGDLAGAVDLFDQRISVGGDDRRSFQEGKADLIGRFGDASEALALVNSLMEDRPGAPSLLNMSCWIKGTREIAIDTAVKDCTAALEGSNSPYAILDSRAMIYYRQGRYEDALRDLATVLSALPAMAESRYLRGIIYARQNRAAESAADLAVARRIKPLIDREYARFGIQP